MATSDAKKVFLSHKGIDKATVVDFKETLELLGYEPWLDEEAMPAGTVLERGLMQGMKDSCGVVFFITPAFEDEGYLQTEINYSLDEKRKRRDKFAIITLLLSQGSSGSTQVPDPLEPFLWKAPKTSLEALREIIRALPVVPGKADWRDGPEGIVRKPTDEPSSELSAEARELLLEAAAGDGYIVYVLTLGGHRIETNDKNMIPDDNPRTIALWRGGFEDLRHRGYIADAGRKGEVFQVTREGYNGSRRTLERIVD